MTDDVEPVDLKWTDEEAEKIAESVFDCDSINSPPSLLSATDIVSYAKKTAFINPFYADKETLKHASYEAKMGRVAYIYRADGRHDVPVSEDGYLNIEANSIVFVESSFVFRLPRYIAVRFNLQIRHVHRGLLLGTGPLVDPGFRGRLLIPLHNLTSEDYYINCNEGLIWIEFTRTTFQNNRPEPYGDYPDRKRVFKVLDWLNKAAEDRHLKKTVVIRSSINPLVDGLREKAEGAVKQAKEAETNSKEARETLNRIGSVVTLAAVATVLTVSVSVFALMVSQISALSSRLDAVQRSAVATETKLADEGAATHQDSDISDIKLQLAALRVQLARMEARDEVSSHVSSAGKLSPASQPVPP